MEPAVVGILVLLVFIAWLGRSPAASPSTSSPRNPDRPMPDTRTEPSPSPRTPIPIPTLAPLSFSGGGIELNDEFRTALSLIAERRLSAFVTGKAGTGKSTLLQCFRGAATGNVVVLAPTGLAAINVGGQTIHSFFKFPPRLIEPDRIRPSRTPEIYRRVETIVIDEVSMVRADVLDGVDAALRINRGQEVPFGGVQIVFFGDLFQLPPIVKERELKEFFASHYGSPYFFRAKALTGTQMPLVELEKVYRQTDAAFLTLLNQVRDRRLEEGALDLLNSRVRELGDIKDRADCVTLTTTNQAAFDLNTLLLNTLAGPVQELTAIVSGKFDPSSYPTEATLRLKKGARVMMIKNDQSRRWVNGTIATVSKVGPNELTVRIGGSSHEVEPATWENIEYYYDRDTERIRHRVVGSFQQFPVRLAWAITIHKSQGHTLDRVHIDLGSGAFAHGQTYVALSRCRTLDGITLARPVFASDVIFDEAIYGYRDVFRRADSISSDLS